MKYGLPILILLVVNGPWISHAYIIRPDTIIKKTVENHGKGYYIVEQEVRVEQNSQEKIVLHEQWLVQDDKNMRLVVTNEKDSKNHIQFAVLFKNNKKYFFSENGQMLTSSVPESFFETYFHVRNANDFFNHIISDRIASASIRSHKQKIEQDAFKPPETSEFLRLSRANGIVSYFIGVPTPIDTRSLNPGLWIEQDRFLIRRIRFDSQAEVWAENYSAFGRGLKLPRQRKVQWDGGQAHIHIVSVQPIRYSSKLSEDLSTKKFALKNGDQQIISRFPESNLIRDFYRRFR